MPIEEYSLPGMQRKIKSRYEYNAFVSACCSTCGKYKPGDDLRQLPDGCDILQAVEKSVFYGGEFPFSDLLDGGYRAIFCKHFHSEDHDVMRDYYRGIGVEIPEQLTFDSYKQNYDGGTSL